MRVGQFWLASKYLFSTFSMAFSCMPDRFIAAAKSDDLHPRAELMGVIADRTPSGVRVRVVANAAHFDISWPLIVRGIK